MDRLKEEGRRDKEIKAQIGKIKQIVKWLLSKGRAVCFCFFFSIANLQQKENKASGVPLPQFTESERENERKRE